MFCTSLGLFQIGFPYSRDLCTTAAPMRRRCGVLPLPDRHREIMQEIDAKTRFSRRLLVREDPVVAAKLERLSSRHGHSLAAEVRAAIRDRLERSGDER